MQWLIDIIKEWVLSLGYATEVWVLGKQYATVIWVGEQIAILKAWVIAQNYATQAWVNGRISWLQGWVISQGYLLQSFYDQGDPAAVDFAVGDLTKDGNWHELDLSGIVPFYAKAVLLEVDIFTPTLGANIIVRELGNANLFNRTRLRCQVSMVANEAVMISSVDGDQKVEYWITNTTWLGLNITVKGWWA